MAKFYCYSTAQSLSRPEDYWLPTSASFGISLRFHSTSVSCRRPYIRHHRLARQVQAPAVRVVSLPLFLSLLLFIVAPRLISFLFYFLFNIIAMCAKARFSSVLLYLQNRTLSPTCHPLLFQQLTLLISTSSPSAHKHTNTLFFLSAIFTNYLLKIMWTFKQIVFIS